MHFFEKIKIADLYSVNLLILKIFMMSVVIFVGKNIYFSHVVYLFHFFKSCDYL